MRQVSFVARQAVLFGLAALGYFGVRGLTEGNVSQADRNAGEVVRLERWLGIDFEQPLQELVLESDLAVDVANWIYIWGHWPVVIATLVWLAVRHRPDFYELRNAMFISGAIGLVIYASFAVTPPRLLAIDYIDTVTENSNSYRVLQPPGLVNKYAAVPSLHFGWNLLVGLSWRRVSNGRVAAIASVVMPAAMAFAVVATGNHWVFDVLAGAVVALAGLGLERVRRRYRVASKAPSGTGHDGQPAVAEEAPLRSSVPSEIPRDDGGKELRHRDGDTGPDRQPADDRMPGGRGCRTTSAECDLPSQWT